MANVADAGEGFQKGPRHAARAQHADDMGILARQILDADPRAAADPHMLDVTVIDKGQRLAVPGAHQHDDAAPGAGFDTVFFFGPVAAFVGGPVHHVRLHADREETVIGALHRAPAPVTVLTVARHVHVDAGPVNRTARGQFPEGLFLRGDAVLHGEDFGDDFIIDDQHDALPVVFRGGR